MAIAFKDLFGKQELIDLSVVILALGFAFSFRFDGPATLGNWFSNLILVILLVLISVIVHEAVHKLVGKKFLVDVKTLLWPSGIITLLVLSIITFGWFVFAAPWAVAMKPLRKGQFARPHTTLTLRQMGLIALSGPMASLGLAIIAKILAPALGLVADKLILINVSLAIFNLFPFFTVIPIFIAQRLSEKRLDAPYVEGEFVFFASRPLWVFVFFFTLVTGLSLLFLSLTSSLIIAVLTAGTIWVVWHYLLEPEVMPGVEAKGPSFKRYK